MLGSYPPAGYMKDSLEFIHLQGLVRNGVADQVLFTLPVGYRPLKDLYCVGISSGATPYIVLVKANGEIKLLTPVNNTYASINAITFKAEQ